MEISSHILDYFRVLAWPTVALLIGCWYRNVIRSLLPGAKVTLTIGGQKVEATIPQIKQSVEESLGGQPLTAEQQQWLKTLYREYRKEIKASDKAILRPLRDSGLLRAYPKGFLQDAECVEITPLGKLLVEQNFTD